MCRRRPTPMTKFPKFPTCLLNYDVTNSVFKLRLKHAVSIIYPREWCLRHLRNYVLAWSFSLCRTGPHGLGSILSVHEIPCICGTVYVGKTKRLVLTKLKELEWGSWKIQRQQNLRKYQITTFYFKLRGFWWVSPSTTPERWERLYKCINEKTTLIKL